MSAAPDKDLAIRDLMLALEYVRSVCEFTEGLRQKDDRRLRIGMCVAIDALQRNKALLPDFQRSSYWDEVKTMDIDHQ